MLRLTIDIFRDREGRACARAHVLEQDWQWSATSGATNVDAGGTRQQATSGTSTSLVGGANCEEARLQAWGRWETIDDEGLSDDDEAGAQAWEGLPASTSL